MTVVKNPPRGTREWQRQKSDAEALVDLLAVRHKDDVFVPECKDGATWDREHIRLDAWAMPRSWTKMVIRGYEVKVARSDFLSDEKWQGYLPLCNELYFVCPAKLIQPEELPAEVGLLWASANGSRLYQKKKAIRRDVEIPVQLFQYVLMSRAAIKPKIEISTKTDRVARWNKHLEEMEGRKSLDWKIKGRIHDVIREQNERIDKLYTDLARLKNVADFLDAQGIDLGHWTRRRVGDRMEELKRGIPKHVRDKIEMAVPALEAIRDLLRSFDDNPTH